MLRCAQDDRGVGGVDMGSACLVGGQEEARRACAGGEVVGVVGVGYGGLLVVGDPGPLTYTDPSRGANRATFG